MSKKNNMPVAGKDNSLRMVIDRETFDAVVDGSLTEQWQSIDDSNYRQLLECDAEGTPLVDADAIDMKELQSLCTSLTDLLFIYNGGEPILAPREGLLYLDLNTEDGDRAIAAIEDTDLCPVTDDDEKIIRFDFDKDNHPFRDDEKGRYCYWEAVYTLGKIDKKNKR